MTSTSKRYLVASLLAAFGATAFAQAPAPATTPAGPGARHEQMARHDPAKMQERTAKMKERMAKRLGELKTKLAITPAQEGAWTTWTTAIQPPATRPARPSREEMAKLTTPERIDKMREMQTQRQALMTQRADATKTFYAGLNTDQKKLFDAEATRFMARGHGRHGGGGHGGHGGHHGMQHKG